MPVYTANEIAGFAKQAGIPDDRVPIMVAIAFAESNGNSDDVSGPNHDGTYDTGLWQINSIHGIENPSWTRSWLRNPVNNATAMAALSNNGVDLSPWNASRATWLPAVTPQSDRKGGINWGQNEPKIIKDARNGLGNFLKQAYKPGWDALTMKVDASGIPIVGPAIDAINNTEQATISVAKYTAKTAVWISNPQNWLRIAYVSLGAGVVLVGLAKLMGVNDITGTALSVVPGGSLAKTAGTKVGTAQANSASTQYTKTKSAATNPPKAKGVK